MSHGYSFLCTEAVRNYNATCVGEKFCEHISRKSPTHQTIRDSSFQRLLHLLFLSIMWFEISFIVRIRHQNRARDGYETTLTQWNDGCMCVCVGLTLDWIQVLLFFIFSLSLWNVMLILELWQNKLKHMGMACVKETELCQRRETWWLYID